VAVVPGTGRHHGPRSNRAAHHRARHA
jgi:hypothetical protein